jgi:hypothetical protein
LFSAHFSRAIQSFGFWACLVFLSGIAKVSESHAFVRIVSRKPPANYAASRRQRRKFSGVIFAAGGYATLSSGVNFRLVRISLIFAQSNAD